MFFGNEAAIFTYLSLFMSLLYTVLVIKSKYYTKTYLSNLAIFVLRLNGPDSGKYAWLFDCETFA